MFDYDIKCFILIFYNVVIIYTENNVIWRLKILVFQCCPRFWFKKLKQYAIKIKRPEFFFSMWILINCNIFKSRWLLLSYNYLYLSHKLSKNSNFIFLKNPLHNVFLQYSLEILINGLLYKFSKNFFYIITLCNIHL